MTPPTLSPRVLYAVLFLSLGANIFVAGLVLGKGVAGWTGRDGDFGPPPPHSEGSHGPRAPMRFPARDLLAMVDDKDRPAVRMIFRELRGEHRKTRRALADVTARLRDGLLDAGSSDTDLDALIAQRAALTARLTALPSDALRQILPMLDAADRIRLVDRMRDLNRSHKSRNHRSGDSRP